MGLKLVKSAIAGRLSDLRLKVLGTARVSADSKTEDSGWHHRDEDYGDKDGDRDRCRPPHLSPPKALHARALRTISEPELVTFSVVKSKQSQVLYRLILALGVNSRHLPLNANVYVGNFGIPLQSV